MTEQKLCGVCGKADATDSCSECNIPLCDACMKKVEIPDESLGYQVKAMSISPVRRSIQVKKVCPDCLTKVEFI